MEEAGVIQNLFSSCDRGMTLHASILGKKFTALLGLDQVPDLFLKAPNIFSCGFDEKLIPVISNVVE